jgi:branched-chain amino acid transport system permease protein
MLQPNRQSIKLIKPLKSLLFKRQCDGYFPYILVNTFITGGMWALMAIGLALLFSVMNIAGFAHGEYFMAGSLTAYFVMQPISNYTLEHPESFMAYVGPMIAILAGTFMCAFLGILTERLVFKQLRMRNREGWLLNCFLITLGISVIFQNTHQLAFGANFKGILAYWDFPSVPIFGVYMSIDRICAFFIAILTMIGFYIFMMFSTSGKTIRAVSQDEDGARMVGISVDTVHVGRCQSAVYVSVLSNRGRHAVIQLLVYHHSGGIW